MILGVLGFIGSGKDTVAKILTADHNYTHDSFAKSLKDACAAMFDWPRHLLDGDTPESREYREMPDEWWSSKLGIPNFTPRHALQVMGTNVLRDNFHQDMWFLTVSNRIRKNPSQNIVISDVRFPNEIKFITEQGGILIRVDRGILPAWHETAAMANRGNNIAKDIMNKTYAGAHLSEWAWVGTQVDYLVENNSTVDNLKSQVDHIINTINK